MTGIGRIRMFGALRHRNYRLFIVGTSISHTGTWMQRLAQDWLVLRLTDNDGVALGIASGLQFVPMLLFGPLSGALADRYPKRRLLFVSAVMMGAAAAALAVLDVTGAVQLWHVYVLSALLGLGWALELPARQSFVFEMVGKEDTPNAVGLNSLSFNIGRTAGPLLAGIGIVTVGTGPVIAFNAVSYGAVIAALALMNPALLQAAPRLAWETGQIRDGIRYLRNHPQLSSIIITVFVAGLFGQNVSVSIALMSTEVFGRGPGGYGALAAAMAIGAAAGALFAAGRGGNGLRSVALAVLMFAAFTLMSSASPSYPVFLVVLVCVGFCWPLVQTAANTTLQLAADSGYRGRVMALYVTVLQGGGAVGAPLVGAAANSLGARTSLLLGGLICIVAAAAGVAVLARHRRYDARTLIRLVIAARHRGRRP